MTKLYLIRHAEAEGNLYRIAQGQSQSALTDLGRRQLAALEARFRDIRIDAVYASDLYRTRATAEAVCIPKQLPLHLRRELREVHVGAWEKMTWGEIARDYPQEMEDFSQHLDRSRVPGGETAARVRDRIVAAVERIARENEGGTVAVVTHGYAIRVLLGTVQGLTLAQIGQTPHGGNTAVSLLEWDGRCLHCVFRDDDSHLRAGVPDGGEGRKRPTALEPGLYFTPVCLPEQADILLRMAREAWEDSADPRPFDAARLLADAAVRPTLTAARLGQPAGFLQLEPEGNDGRLSLYCIDRGLRRRGCGVQLLGQAVEYFRDREREGLTVALADGNADGRRFFAEYGFSSDFRRTADGREIFRKGIGFLPLRAEVIID